MKTAQALLVSIALAFSASTAAAQVIFNAPMQFRGTGCQDGQYAFAGQGTDTLTIMFSAYDAARPTSNAASGMFRTACSFSVPVRVPQGLQVSTLTSDWRGYAQGNVELHREYFFAGDVMGPKRTTKPSGNYVERDNLMHATWSACGAGIVHMRINSSVRAISHNSYIAVDTNDLQNKVIFQVKSRGCR